MLDQNRNNDISPLLSPLNEKDNVSLQLLQSTWGESFKGTIQLPGQFNDSDFLIADFGFKRHGETPDRVKNSASTDDALSAVPKKQLEKISLGGSDITNSGLLSLDGAKTIRDIDLVGTKIGNQGLYNLTTLELDQLSSLFLDDTLVTDDGMASISKFTSLDTLSLRLTDITDDGMKRLSDMPHLRYLDVSGTAVSDAGLKHLANSKSIRTLILDGTAVTDEGLKHLQNFPNLDIVVLNNTKISEAGLAHLAQCPKLSRVGLAGTEENISNNAVRKLVKTLRPSPGCPIEGRSY